MLMRKSNRVCEYWDCDTGVTGSDYLCDKHHKKWLDGTIDRCPKCSRFKDTIYRYCLDCYLERPIKKRKPAVVSTKQKKSPRELYTGILRGDYPRQERYFVYVIEFDGGVFYVGYTRDIHRQISGLGKKKSTTSGYSPKLQFLEIIAGEKDAELREAELKKLVQSDPKQIRSMSSDFYQQMKEYGFE
jgi:predicted GIY-YIG superfamily endonuclease